MKKALSFILVILLAIPLLASCSNGKPTDDELYANAVRDAVFADEDEILPLIDLSSANDQNVIRSEDGKSVLVAFMHKYPDSYPAGEEIELKWGNVWCVSAGEFHSWVKDHSKNTDDWTKRLHQVMGMPYSKGYNTITALWIDASLIYRPAYVTDPNAKMKNTLQKTGNEDFDAKYKSWFDGNIIWSYFDSAFPWTRLGYTYDWADNGTEYGLSEFIIFSGAPAKVEYTYSVDDFVSYVTK